MKNTLTFSGKILSSRTQKGVAGIRVEAWDKDMVFDDLLGVATTGTDGTFTITVPPVAGLEVLDTLPDVFFRIYRGDKEIGNTLHNILRNVTANLADIVFHIETDEKGGDPVSSTRVSVAGVVTERDGTGIGGAAVKVMRKALRSEFVIAATVTIEDGRFLAAFDKQEGVDEYDLVVRVYEGKTEIASSQTLYDIRDHARVALVRDNEKLQPVSRYKRLLRALEPQLDGLSFAQLTEEQIQYLSRKTSFRETSIRRVKAAYTFWEQHGVDPEPVFGLLTVLRADSAAKLKQLSARSTDMLLRRAHSKSIISENWTQFSADVSSGLHRASSREAIAPSEDGLTATLGDMLQLTSLPAKLREDFAFRLRTATSTGSLWKELEADDNYKTGGLVNELRVTLQVGKLTGNFLPLMREVRKAQGKDTSLLPFVEFTESDWVRFFRDKNTGVPSDIAGEDAKQKAANYARMLTHTLEKNFPSHKALAGMKSHPDHIHKDTGVFAQLASGFDFGTTPVKKYLSKNRSRFEGKISDPAQLEKDLMSLQRLYRIGPETNRFEAMHTLYASGYNSGVSITRGLSRSAFVNKFGGQFGRDAAAAIYDQAGKATGITLGVIGKVWDQQVLQGPGAVVSGDEGSLGAAASETSPDIPDLASLFGSMSYCACEHCRSVLSPAAYMVDLLQFLINTPVDADGDGTDETDAQAKLFERRSDLGDIKLSCENTNTALPYIDLVNEILENAVVEANGGTAVTSYQTEGTTKELQSQPEHQNATAYEYTGGAVYPFTLPFHLWNREGAIYLRQAGTERSRLARKLYFTGTGTEPDTHTISCIQLGLSEAERDIITGESVISGTHYPLKQFWGMDGGDWKTRLSNVDTFLTQSGLEYADLRQLLQVHFLNPDGDIHVEFDSESDPCDVSTATLQKADGSEPDEIFFERAHRFLRLLKHTPLTLLQLGDVIDVLEATDLSRVFINRVAALLYLSGELRVPAEEILCWNGSLSVMKDVNDAESRSFYETIFLNKAVLNPTEEVFELNAGETRLQIEDDGTVVDLFDYTYALTASLRVSSSDLTLIAGTLADSSLTFENLCAMYRITSAARAFRLTVEEFLVLRNLIESNPFAEHNPVKAIDFAEKVQLIRNSGFKPEELGYLFLHDYDEADGIAPLDKDTGEQLADIQSALQKVYDEYYISSDPTGEQTRSWLGLFMDETQLPEAIAIIRGTSTLSPSEQNAFIVDYFIFADAVAAQAELDNTSGVPDETEIQERYAWLFEELRDYLITDNSEKAVGQALSDPFHIDLDTALLLLTELATSPADSSLRAMDEFMDPSFAYDDSGETPDYDSFPEQFEVFRLLHKVSMIVSRLNFSNEEMAWAYENWEAAGWPELNALPLEAGSGDGQALLNSWTEMLYFSQLKRKYTGGEQTMIDLLDMAVNPSDYDPDTTVDLLQSSISGVTGWDVEELSVFAGASCYAFALEDYTKASVLRQLHDCMMLLEQFGASAADIWGWAAADLTEDQSTAIKQAAKAKYSETQWFSIAPGLRDKLREQQRDALVAWLTGNGGFEDEEALFDHYLIDVEMNGCMLTSRIKQAISSIQLYIQRSFLGLEAAVEFDADQKELWEWMKNYRVWEANRKVFIFPENWLEPELREDKSQFFEELENELLQGEVTEDRVETALLNYLTKLDETSRIDVMGQWRQQETTEDETIDILHVVGRTSNPPFTWYYRNRENEKWTPWERIDLEIEADHAMPVVLNRRLYIFWPTFREVSVMASDLVEEFDLYDFLEDSLESYFDIYYPGMTDSEALEAYINDELTEPFLKYEVTMHFSEYKEGRWQKKRSSRETISSDSAIAVLLYVQKDYVLNKSMMSFYTIPYASNSKVKINCFQSFEDAELSSELGLAWRFSCGTFTFDVSTQEISAGNRDYEISYRPNSTENYYNKYRKDDGVSGLEMDVASDGSSVPVLAANQGTYYMPMIHQVYKFYSQYDCFFRDPYHSYFIHPEDTMVWAGGGFGGGSKGLEFESETWFRFHNFDHPYTGDLIKSLNLGGPEDMMARSMQESEEVYFEDAYSPVKVKMPYPKREIDFSTSGAVSQYNWELFFHAPLLIADRLSQNQQYEEAMRWFHFIFDPTGRDTSVDAPQRYWNFRPFFEETTIDTLYDMMYALAYEGTDPEIEALREEVAAQVEVWKANPFDPHAVAGLRTSAYMRSTVMKYLDNLIAWGDSLFRIDTIEAINEATQLYVLASKILGERPEEIPTEETEDLSYNELKAEGIDAYFSNALVETESLVVEFGGTGGGPSLPHFVISVAESLYFCLPHNEKLISYWDKVEDRLFKIRNCMNIDGVKRSLALFEPPIDPAMLIKAKAAGVDLGSVLSDMYAPLPNYRFTFLAAKAMQYAADVQALGGALLSALEKKDAEALSLLRASQEITLQDSMRDIKKLQLQEANEQLTALKRQKEITQLRYEYYRDIKKISGPETAALVMSGTAAILQAVAEGLKLTSGGTSLVPDFTAGVIGVMPVATTTTGGQSVSNSTDKFSGAFSYAASILNQGAAITSTLASYERRWEDWKLQEKLASKELKQTDKQIAAAEIRVEIAEKDMEQLDLQREQSRETYSFLKDKFTNEELYAWMCGQISTVYFQAYQLAYDLGKRAQKAFQYELGSDQTFLQYGYWDSLKKGLLAGDKLQHDLKRMEMAWLDQNRRQMEVTKHISLALLDPSALLMLRETGACYISLPEEIFDLDFPGHYQRRVKTVSLTIPCITGPYTGINCTLTLLDNQYRKDPETSSGYEEAEGGGDVRFVYNQAAIQSVAISQARNDAGVFQLNFQDERFLPFEGAGAVSAWRLQFPASLRAFDYHTITDVVMHLSYTAKDGGETMRQAATDGIETRLTEIALGSGNTGLTRMFSARTEFGSEWYRFLHPATGSNPSMTLQFSAAKFPYLFRDYTIGISRIEVLAVTQDAEVITTPLVIEVTPASLTTAVPLSLTASAALGNAPYADSGTGTLSGASAGDWTFEVSGAIPAELADAEDTSLPDADKVRDLIVVLHYGIS